MTDRCFACGQPRQVRKDGMIAVHSRKVGASAKRTPSRSFIVERCPGSGKLPRDKEFK